MATLIGLAGVAAGGAVKSAVDNVQQKRQEKKAAKQARAQAAAAAGKGQPRGIDGDQDPLLRPSSPSSVVAAPSLATSVDDGSGQAPSSSNPTPTAPSLSASTPNQSKSKLRGRREDSPDVRMSKTLSYILRHGAAKEGLKMRNDGYVRVDELLARPKLREVDLPTLKRLVAENEKQRYALKEDTDPLTGEENVLFIRANQGHSLKGVEELELERINDPTECPVVVHGTFARHWDSISKEGLKVMNRHHIHCAPGLYGQEGVTSGMRASCDLYIYVDIAKAMADGIVFERSSNGVILTKGRNGVLPPEYFKEVKTKQGQSLLPLSDQLRGLQV